MQPNPNLLHPTMQEAMQLMRAGNLQGATAAIQRGLQRQHAHESRNEDVAAPARHGHVFDGDYVDVSSPPTPAVATEVPASTDVRDLPSMHTGVFACAAGSREYLVYAPAVMAPEPAPMLMMLHGCTQDADDFARGTRMHLRAALEGYVVVYPRQSRRDNPNACWNWFRPGDQQRDAGEPAILAGLLAELRQRFNGDARRMHVAGLSAGGAMAVTLARTYPEMFRGVGVHSGLPHGCARDVPGALAAMRSGAPPAPTGCARRAPVVGIPTIVFHGDRDHTVNVGNATRIVEDALAVAAGDGEQLATTCTTGQIPGGHAFTTTCFADAAGAPRAERWIVHGGGHAWYGGHADGSYTAARGPDATGEMLRFFRNLGPRA